MAPVAAYAMDEGGGGTVADGTGNGNTGTLSGTSWTDGQYGGGLDFNGTSSQVMVPHAASLVLGGELTISAWVRPRSLGNYNTIVSKGTGALNYWFDIVGSEINTGFYSAGFREFQTNGANLQTATWYYLAYTYNDVTDTVAVYVNGALQNTFTTTNAIPASLECPVP